MLRASIAAASKGKAREGRERQGIPCHTSGHSYAGDLQDAVPDLFGQHELRVRGHAHQDLVELEVAAGAYADHATFAQQVDEVLEQGAVEELGRVESVQ